MPQPPVYDWPEDAAERGRLHGEAMPELVRANIETYLARFEAGGLSREEALERGEAWVPRIEAIDGAYAAEMLALARAANVSPTEIAMLNARYELTYGVFGSEAATPGREPDGCTSFGLLARATRLGRPIIGQNWDWLAKIVGHTFVMRVKRREKPSFVGFTEAGIVGCKMGVNEAGVGLCVNGLVSGRDGRSPWEKPFHVRCREILDATGFAAALGAVTSTDRVGSANFVVGDAGDEIVNIEAAPDTAAFIHPDEDGMVVHANHFEVLQGVRSMMERVSPSTIFRAARFRRLLKDRKGTLDVEGLREVLSDRFGHPNAICRYPDTSLPEPKRVLTAASIVVDLAERTLYATDGPPAEGPFGVYPLHG